MSHKHSLLFAFPLTMLGITIVMGYLATVPNTSADNTTTDTNSSLSPVDDTINITVDSSCTMGIISSSSITDIIPGETKNIGFYNMAAYCNDSNGYDIYAIGYTNGEYGNTDMISTNGNTIYTGTSGEDSYWNVRLTPGTATGQTTHIPTIVSPFNNDTTIPSDYTKVVTYPSTTIPQGTDPTESGSYFKADYYTHASTTLPAGTYTGQVQYVMVHPVGAEAPIFMQNTTAIKAMLTNEGDTMQAIDKRDGKKYWITKLADGNIWMTQNLDHDIVAGKTYTSTDTDLPENTTWTPGTSTRPTGDYTWGSNYDYPESYDPGDLYWDGVATSQYKTIAEGTVASSSDTSGGTHYHIGNYYNWTAAIAMSDSRSYITQYQNVDQSICPAGWRLPVYSGDKSFEKLKSKQDLTAGASGNVQNSPTYLIYGSGWGGNPQGTGMGSEGHYWSNIVYDKYTSYVLMLNFRYNSVDPQSAGMGGVRMFGKNVRCVTR